MRDLEFFEGFEKRMQILTSIDSIINRLNRNKEIEARFEYAQLDNIIFSVLVFIMERTLSEDEECTLGSISAFLEQKANPFGPISSEHLLQPMFEIAKRHRTQLICLSDLKQNSIMNCFNLIYMLKIRTGAIDGKEYLKFE
jgi:hypothetical protein